MQNLHLGETIMKWQEQYRTRAKASGNVSPNKLHSTNF